MTLVNYGVSTMNITIYSALSNYFYLHQASTYITTTFGYIELETGCGTPAYCAGTDLDKSGAVGFADLDLLTQQLLQGI
jgi:hypothetical protein